MGWTPDYSSLYACNVVSVVVDLRTVYPRTVVIEMMIIRANRSGIGTHTHHITLYGDNKKGKSFKANGVPELHLAIDHYFKENHVVGNGIGVKGCPLCRGA